MSYRVVAILAAWIVLINLGLQSAHAAGKAAPSEFPARNWPTAELAAVGLDARLLNHARDYALTGDGSGYITRGGKLVLSWGDPRKRYDLKSTTKSFGATALGVAVLDGKIALTDKARKHYPTFGMPPDDNEVNGWADEITILHLATQTAGFEKSGGFGKLLFRPGTKWCYSDGGPNWLADCVTRAYGRDVDELMFERVFTPLGITRDDLVWRKNSYRPKDLDSMTRREFGSGISANVDAMARIGYLYLRQGEWNGTRILPAGFVRQSGTTVPAVVGLEELDEKKDYGDASNHYGLLWWNNADGALKNVPRDAFWSWGLYDSLIVVIPSLDIVAARAGNSWKRKDKAEHYDVLCPFLEPIAMAAAKADDEQADETSQADDLLERKPDGDGKKRGRTKTAVAPYPPSSEITGIEWAPKSEIVRRARGSDNWPITWADDDRQYTAYGDGQGFEPLIDMKLSLGLACIDGGPSDFTTINLRSTSAERRGDGPKGNKASGMLMVDGVLYMLVRNAINSQLAWSRDHGQKWSWSDWRFTDSFGCPTFLNFSRNYAGARDEYVYVYSHNADSAYRPTDGVVLARVHRQRIVQREAYEFFAGTDSAGRPTWTSDVAGRRAVFSNARHCYRTTVSYHAATRRYLLCQILPGDDPRFTGGFGIYDAPEPWGPWTTVFFTETWDVGPGETASIPTKWISSDGQTIHLVFSGDDHFSVRRATLAFERSAQ